MTVIWRLQFRLLHQDEEGKELQEYLKPLRYIYVYPPSLINDNIKSVMNEQGLYMIWKSQSLKNKMKSLEKKICYMFLKVVEFRGFCQIFVRWFKQVASALDCVLSCSDQYYSNFVKEFRETTDHWIKVK